MQLPAVQSSNLAAAGYLEEDQVLLVRFQDGALYSYRGVMPENYASFEAAQSKGAWLKSWNENSAAACRPAGVLLQKEKFRNPAEGGTLSTEATQSTDQGGGSQAATSLLQTYQEDDCCGGRILKFLQTPAALQATTWKCPKCETEWFHRMHGVVRHWYPRVHTMVMRPRR